MLSLQLIFRQSEHWLQASSLGSQTIVRLPDNVVLLIDFRYYLANHKKNQIARNFVRLEELEYIRQILREFFNQKYASMSVVFATAVVGR